MMYSARHKTYLNFYLWVSPGPFIQTCDSSVPASQAVTLVVSTLPQSPSPQITRDNLPLQAINLQMSYHAAHPSSRSKHNLAFIMYMVSNQPWLCANERRGVWHNVTAGWHIAQATNKATATQCRGADCMSKQCWGNNFLLLQKEESSSRI